MAWTHPQTTLARQARAALVMDTLNMTFDPTPTRRAFRGIRLALKDLLEGKRRVCRPG